MSSVFSISTCSADRLLAHAEKRSDEWAVAETAYLEIKGNREVWEASSKEAYRSRQGLSMNAAENLLKTVPEWLEYYTQEMGALITMNQAKRAYTRAVHAIDLYRTESSTARTLGR